MHNKKSPIRHGETMLVPIDSIPEGKIEKHTSFIVGHSETGHHHVLESDTKFETIVDKEELYFHLFEPAKLVHTKEFEKHRTLTIPAGLYKRFHDTEYSPFTGLINAVKD